MVNGECLSDAVRIKANKVDHEIFLLALKSKRRKACFTRIDQKIKISSLS